jgi:cytochrome c biogenesis protein CcmG, thiol:disulfide interchange protein DsbE
VTQTVGRDAEIGAPITVGDVEEVVPRRAHTARWIAITVGVVVALFVLLLATRPSAESGKADSPLLGRIAPDTSGPDLDGTTFSLASARGKYVVVNFFASWCIPCQTEQPDLQRFADRHATAGDARIIGVVYDDEPDRVREFLAKDGGNWPVIDSPGSKVDWGVRGVPESFLVDPDGYVIAHIVGGVKADRLESLLQNAKHPRS